MRRTYYNRNQDPGLGEEEDEQQQQQQPPPPPPASGGWLRTTMTIAVSAVIGAVAVDIYRRYFSKDRGDGDDMGAATVNPYGALPGAPSIMPMPLPLPMPMPIPWGGGYMGPPQPPAPNPGYRDERPLTEQEKLELARYKAEEAKANAARAHWEAFVAEGED